MKSSISTKKPVFKITYPYQAKLSDSLGCYVPGFYIAAIDDKGEVQYLTSAVLKRNLNKNPKELYLDNLKSNTELPFKSLMPSDDEHIYMVIKLMKLKFKNHLKRKNKWQIKLGELLPDRIFVY